MKIGAGDMSALYVGGAAATKAYIGSTLAWEAGGVAAPFIMTVETTTASETFTITCNNYGTFDATVDWGDGTTSAVTAYNDPDLAHVYASAGTHTISISGTFQSIYMLGSPALDKLRTVEQLGDLGWLNIRSGFQACSGLTKFHSGSCDTSAATQIENLVWGCAALTDVDVTTLQTDSALFLTNMFRSTGISSVDVSGWNLSAAQTAVLTFASLGAVDVIGLDTWDVSGFTSFTSFLQSSTLPTARYDALLIAWGAQAVNSGVAFDGGGSKYTAGGAAEAGRNALIAAGWTITDGGPV